MEISECFKIYCNNFEITEDERSRWKEKRISTICKCLNKKYYDSISPEDNMTIVGSVGRNTAISGVSDWDCIYNLPKEVYKKFDEYESNGQSQLLQEIKKEIKKSYPNTNIKGDGQVVVISFNDGKIELVPGFKQLDDSYKYPNSNDGGSWKKTDPIPEIEAAKEINSLTNGHYKYLCQIMRKWKNNIGFKFKGLLIDTLVKDFMEEEGDRKNIDFVDYKIVVRDLFYFLSIQDESRKYWHALGSNQQISNDDEGKFIKKATKAYNKLKDCQDDEEFKTAYIDLFGREFAGEVEASVRRAANENFIEEMFEVDIRYNINLDCDVEQKGFRRFSLSYYITNRWKLKKNKNLTFKVESTNIPSELENSIVWYWKVRNVGYEAKRRKMERGEIRKGKEIWKESTTFSGEHYVECYAVHDDVVVARDRIAVPIDTVKGV